MKRTHLEWTIPDELTAEEGFVLKMLPALYSRMTNREVVDLLRECGKESTDFEDKQRFYRLALMLYEPTEEEQKTQAMSRERNEIRNRKALDELCFAALLAVWKTLTNPALDPAKFSEKWGACDCPAKREAKCEQA